MCLQDDEQPGPSSQQQLENDISDGVADMQVRGSLTMSEMPAGKLHPAGHGRGNEGWSDTTLLCAAGPDNI